MQKVKILGLSLFTLSLVTVITGLLYRHFQKSFPDKDIQLNSPFESLLEVADHIEGLWISGRYPEGSLNCDEVLQLEELLGRFPLLDRQQLFRCDPMILSCFLSGKEKSGIEWRRPDRSLVTVFPERVKAQELVVTLFAEDGRVVNSPKKHFFKLRALGVQESLLFSLEDTCSESSLPEGRYAHGPQPVGQSDFLWDSTGQKIKIDRYPVSWGEFKRWLRTRPDLSFDEEMGNHFMPADRVSLEWQWSYCEAQGKTILQSHIFDAAAFYPAQISASHIAVLPRGPYPQGRRRTATVMGRYLEGQSEELELEGHCLEVYTRECAEWGLPLLARLDTGSSHSGIFSTLGGIIEHIRNPWSSEHNLALASQYFFADSPLHALGVRGGWDGTGFDERSINSEQEITFPRGELGIGFRCMRRVQ